MRVEIPVTDLRVGDVLDDGSRVAYAPEVGVLLLTRSGADRMRYFKPDEIVEVIRQEATPCDQP